MGVSREGGVPLDCGTNLADILSSALPSTPHDKSKEKSSDSSVSYIVWVSVIGNNFNNNCFNL